LTEAGGSHRLRSVALDEASLAPAGRAVEDERRQAISDLIEANHFHPVDAEGGPYDLVLALVEQRLAFDVTGPGYERRHLLSLNPFKQIIRDYFLICESYNQAIRDASPAQIEAVDMGRRGLHNEGSELLRERLHGKIETDLDTARRLFTLICALHRRN
jgi:uncharacterized protein (UPF0262 family)